MKTYEQAGKAVSQYVAGALAKRRPDLAEAGVTVSCLFCGGGLTQRGYAAHAVVKINSLKDRAEGKADCTITFDGDHYDSWPEPQRAAIVHHELYHLILVRDADGSLKRDDLGRPKLRLRLHDIEIGGFREIIEEHREAAPEAQAVARAAEFVQGLFQF